MMDHEIEHESTDKQNLTGWDSLVSPVADDKWHCCSCVDAKVDYIARARDYFLAQRNVDFTQTEINDYPPNSPELNQQIKVEMPKYISDRDAKKKDLDDAKNKMDKACQ